MSKYIYWVKKDLFGCFRMEEIRDKDNETGLKEGRVIEMSTTVLHYAMHALFRFEILTTTRCNRIVIKVIFFIDFIDSRFRIKSNVGGFTPCNPWTGGHRRRDTQCTFWRWRWNA